MKFSIIWKYSKNDLEYIINTSTSISEVLTKLGVNPKGNNYKTLKERCIHDNIDLSELKIRSNNERKKRCTDMHKKDRTPNDQIFIKNSKTRRHIVKRRILQDSLVPYICDTCGNAGIHNNIPLTLHLDHINGISNDNTLSNLRFLCPNCHSQTSTYAGKQNKKDKKYLCPECEINYKSKNGKMCKECSNIKRRKVVRPTSIELQNLLDNNTPLTSIGKLYGVSDNTVRKWIKYYKQV